MSTKIVQVKPLTLSSNIGTSNTTAIVSGMIGLDGADLTQADFGSIIYGTFEPNTDREEAVSFTITSNTGGVANIDFGGSGRGLIGKSPYGTGGITYAHSAGAKLVISNNPNLFNKFTAKDNAEIVTAQWSFPDPTSAQSPATKTYVDTELAGEVATLDAAIDAEAATRAAADTALDNATVKKTGDETVAGVKTFSSSPIVPTATTATQAVNKAQVEAYIAANSGDVKATEAIFGTVKLDVPADDIAEPIAITATADRVAALEGINNPPTVSNPLVTKDDLSDPTVLPPQVVTFTSSGTWTKDAGLKYIIVEVQGAGGAGGAGYGTGTSPDDFGGGGAAGGYAKKLILASNLASTETVTIGTAGTGSTGANGGDGGNTSFGSHVTANGGGGGKWGNDSSSSQGGVGGTATGGDINVTGDDGYDSGSLDQSSYSGKGASSPSGSGGRSVANNSTLGQTATGYGAGGSGGGVYSNQNWAGGSGTPGIVIVTEYYS